MSLRRFFNFSCIVWALIALSLSASVADLMFGRWKILPLPPTQLTLLMFSGLALLAILSQMLSAYSGRLLVSMVKHNASVYLPYILLAFVSLMWGGLPGAFWGDKGKWIFLITYGFFIFLSATIFPLLPMLGRRARHFLQLPLIILTGSVFYELNNPGTFSTVISRAAGFAGNSNFGALSINFLCAAVLCYGRENRVKRDIFWLLVAGIAVFNTQSRSGLLGFLVILFSYAFFYLKTNQFSVVRIAKLLATFFVGLLIIVATITLIAENSTIFKQGNKTRLQKIMEGGASDDGSADSRLAAAEDAIRRIEKSPVLGHGTGHTRYMDPPPHNIYLQQWVANGAAGLCLYLLTLFAAFRVFYRDSYRPGQVFIGVTLVGGLFSHNILEQHPFLLIFGILLTDSFLSRKEMEQSHLEDLEMDSYE